jgi:hypothetical protein
MPDVHEVFRIATKNVLPDAGFVDRQLDLNPQWPRSRPPRLGVFAVVAMVALLATILLVRELSDYRAQPAAPGRTTGSSAPADEGHRAFADTSVTDLAPNVPFATFESARYRYSIGYPETWVARAATRSLTYLGVVEEIAPQIDRFSATRQDFPASYPSLMVGAEPLDTGTTTRAWTSEVEQFVDRCGPPTTRESVTVDGEKAILAFFPECYFQGRFQYWTTFVHDGMGYHVIWTGNTGDEARDRIVLDRILKGFRLTT